MAVRLLVVDDHRIFAEALATRLETEPDISVLGTVGSAAEASQAIARLRPDLVVLDENLTECDGIRLAASLHQDYPHLRFLILTCLVEDWSRAVDAMRAGASAWVSKDAPIDEMLEALRGAASEEAVLPAEAAPPARAHRWRGFWGQATRRVAALHPDVGRPAGVSTLEEVARAPQLTLVTDEEPATKPAREWGRRVRLARSLALVALVSILAVPALFVSTAHARPGEPLYVAKLSIEKVQLVLERDPTDRVALHLEIMKRRLLDIDELLAEGKKSGPELNQVIDNLRSHQRAADGVISELGGRGESTGPLRSVQEQAQKQTKVFNVVLQDAGCGTDGAARACPTLVAAAEVSAKVGEKIHEVVTGVTKPALAEGSNRDLAPGTSTSVAARENRPANPTAPPADSTGATSTEVPITSEPEPAPTPLPPPVEPSPEPTPTPTPTPEPTPTETPEPSPTASASVTPEGTSEPSPEPTSLFGPVAAAKSLLR
ncbi:MAG: response regulator [Actinomycetota bacterium]